MIVLNPQSVVPQVLQHKGCGGYVEQPEWMRKYMSDFYRCPKCESLLHKNNVGPTMFFPVA